MLKSKHLVCCFSLSSRAPEAPCGGPRATTPTENPRTGCPVLSVAFSVGSCGQRAGLWGCAHCSPLPVPRCKGWAPSQALAHFFLWWQPLPQQSPPGPPPRLCALNSPWVLPEWSPTSNWVKSFTGQTLDLLPSPEEGIFGKVLGFRSSLPASADPQVFLRGL